MRHFVPSHPSRRPCKLIHFINEMSFDGACAVSSLRALSQLTMPKCDFPRFPRFSKMADEEQTLASKRSMIRRTRLLLELGRGGPTLPAGQVVL